MHQSSYQKMEAFVSKYLDPNKELKILEMGSYDVNGTYKDLFLKPNWTYEGCDIAPGPNVDIVMSDLYKIPLPDGSYDVVVSGSTLEHVEYFWVWIKEVARLVRPGGLMCHIAPGTGATHPTPVDCWRFRTDGMIVLAKWIDFEVLEAYTDPNNYWWDCTLVCRKP